MLCLSARRAPDARALREPLRDGACRLSAAYFAARCASYCHISARAKSARARCFQPCCALFILMRHLMRLLPGAPSCLLACRLFPTDIYRHARCVPPVRSAQKMASRAPSRVDARAAPRACGVRMRYARRADYAQQIYVMISLPTIRNRRGRCRCAAMR